jgi:arylsulfatase A-like enzyme
MSIQKNGKPNVVFIFADEWRVQATGYNNDPNCETPLIDKLAGVSVNLSQAVSGQPICCPYRASLLTGQYPLTHGVFTNDVELKPDNFTIAYAFNREIELRPNIPEALRKKAVEELRGYYSHIAALDDAAALLYCPVESCELIRDPDLHAYRGLRSARYTYVKSTGGPWLLYDLKADPYQMDNLIDSPGYAELQKSMDRILMDRLGSIGDEFLDGWTYLERAGLTHYAQVNEHTDQF